MAQVHCQCGQEINIPFIAVGKAARCAGCKNIVRFVAPGLTEAELPMTQFDACLVIENGLDRIGEQIFLGGSFRIAIGKSPELSLFLKAPLVSQLHCTLTPTGNGDWAIEDNDSKNGLYVDGRRVQGQDLIDGQLIAIGDYSLRFHSSVRHVAQVGAEPQQVETVQSSADQPETTDEWTYGFVEEPQPPLEALPPAFIAPPETGGPVCPGCHQHLGAKAKICVTCGIDLRTGRPLVISRGIDENILHHNAYNIGWWLSWIIPFCIIPIASEAFGFFKPHAVRAIALVTALISITVWIVNYESNSHPYGAAKELMLWAGSQPDPAYIEAIYLYPGPASDAFHELEDQITKREEAKLPPKLADAPPPAALPALPRNTKLTPDQIRFLTLFERQLNEQMNRRHLQPAHIHPKPDIDMSPNQVTMEAYNRLPPEYQQLGSFHVYQLLTHAFLHGGILHLAGNLVFLLVFGNRINALIGQWKSTVLYLVLAILAGESFYLSCIGKDLMPMIGASGAIMGMAGMYFVLMPTSRVHVTIWFRPMMFFLFSIPVLLFLFRLMFFMLFGIGSLIYVIFRLGLIAWIGTFPVRGFWVLLFFIAFDVWATLRGSHDTTAHWAHLGGFVCGMVIALILLLTRQVNANGGDIISLLLGPRAWKILGTPASRMSVA